MKYGHDICLDLIISIYYTNKLSFATTEVKTYMICESRISLHINNWLVYYVVAFEMSKVIIIFKNFTKLHR